MRPVGMPTDRFFASVNHEIESELDNAVSISPLNDATSSTSISMTFELSATPILALMVTPRN